MRALTLEEIAAAMSARVRGPIAAPTVSNVTTDTRRPVAGSLFFAIPGQRFDGHDFVNDALEKGAAAAVVSNLSKIDARYHNTGRLFQVNDTVEALGRLGAWYRRQFAAQVIAVVGSNGKTTVKDLLAAVLGSKKCGRAAQGSFNNAIGVPLTLFSVEPQDEFVVVEIGTNHPGEIMALGRIAQPDLAVITSIGEEHLEFFGNIEAVAREEFSLLSCLRDGAFVAVNAQAAAFAPAKALEGFNVVTYGFEAEANLRASDLTVDSSGQRFKVNERFDYYLPLLGRHNVINALAAVAVGTRFRMTHEETAHSLLAAKPSPMRMQPLQIGAVTIINDAYNANPSSMRTAFEVLDHLPHAGRKVLLLGDMRELGSEAARCHQAVGRDAGRSSAQLIISVGAFARVVADGATSTAGSSKRIYWFPTLEVLSEKIGQLVEPGDAVLLKASRGVGLEKVLTFLAGAVQSPLGR